MDIIRASSSRPSVLHILSLYTPTPEETRTPKMNKRDQIV